MSTIYVGPTAAGAANGTSWANRYGTLNAAEDRPIVAGDFVWVGPGVYRELLTVDVNGGAGTEVTYCADVTGEHTDGIGGIVRITASDNDQTAARGSIISVNDKDYRTFRGFYFNMGSDFMIAATGSPTNWIIEDCVFSPGATRSIRVNGDTQSDWIIRRCVFLGSAWNIFDVTFKSDAGIQDANHLIENCMFGPGIGRGVESDDIGGIVVRNCCFVGRQEGVRCTDSPPVGFTAITVNNCLFTKCQNAVLAVVLGEVVENFNTFYRNNVDRTNVNVGANSQTYPPVFLSPILHSGASQISGFKFPWWFGELSEWSQIRAITGSNEPTEDLRGIVRPTTAAKNSWGPVQFADAERETGTVHTGLVGIALHDAASHQIFVPITATSTTISVYVYREANYAGTNPQLVVKQPGQADDVTTDTAAAAQWNLLSTTFTPAANPPYVVVELQSLNTAAAGDFNCYFDSLAVT